MYSVSSNAVAKCLSYQTTEHQVGYWTDGKPLYEITVFLRVSANGSYNFSTPSGTKIRDWRGNFYQGSIDNPSWIMHIPYTYIEPSNNTFLNIYVFYNGGDRKFYCDFYGTYASSYYNGYARITYKYTKNSD